MFRRYREGFERLGIVAFVIAALTYSLFHLTAGDPFTSPDLETEQALAMEAEIASRCEGEGFALSFCGRHIRATHRLGQILDQLGPAAQAIFLAVGALVIYLPYRWVGEGFKKEGPAGEGPGSGAGPGNAHAMRGGMRDEEP